jgi:hypothetical protein
MVRKRRAVLGYGGFAGLVNVPLELDSGGFEDSHGGVADLGADAVARDERYCVLGQSVLTGDVLPVFEIVGVDLDEVAPLLRHFILRKNRVNRARIDAGAAVYALVRVDEIHVRRVV